MNLSQLAVKYGSDKHGHHNYCVHYEKFFQHLKDKAMTLLELGIGGYEFSDRGGSGLRMWSEYFKQGRIYGLDIFDKSDIKLPARTKIYHGSQIDGDFLTRVMQDIGTPPDIIIDDASHMNIFTIKSFMHLFPWLKSGGIYVIEDIESSWWNTNGFDGEPNHENHEALTSMNFVRDKLVIDVNAKHVPNYTAFYKIESVYFAQNMAIITKK